MPTKNKPKKCEDAVPQTDAEKRFVRDLLIRGEAAKPLSDGELPSGATHKVIENDGEDLPQVERERFSIY